MAPIEMCKTAARETGWQARAIIRLVLIPNIIYPAAQPEYAKYLILRVRLVLLNPAVNITKP